MEIVIGINCECGAMLRDPWNGERPPQGAVVQCPKCERLHLPRGLNADMLARSGMSETDARQVEAAALRLLQDGSTCEPWCHGQTLDDDGACLCGAMKRGESR